MTDEQLNQQMDITFHQVEQRFHKLLNKKNKKNRLNARSIFMEWGEVFTHEDYDEPVEILWVPDFYQFIN
jgi:hypothetical protein